MKPTQRHPVAGLLAKRLATIGTSGESVAAGLVPFRFLPHPHFLVSASPLAHSIGSTHSLFALFLGLPFLIFLPLAGLCAVHVPLGGDLLAADLRARLRSLLATHQSIHDLTVHPLRRRPGSRQVYSYRLVVRDERTGKQNVIELVGKRDTRHAAGKAAKEHKALKMLWDAGFGQKGGLRIPQPLHHFKDLNLVVQEKARGARFRHLLGQGTEASFDHARMVGLWLAKLHNLPVPSAQFCSYDGEKEALQTFVTALAADLPQLGAELQHYGSTIAQLLDSFSKVPATLVHGDFHPDHIFVERGNVTVIDFERFGTGDPARDLGSFIAHMRTTAGFSGKSMEEVNRQIDEFLRSYYGNVPLRQGISVSARLIPFVSLSCLEALYYVASVLKVKQPSRIALYVGCLREAGLPLIGTGELGPLKEHHTASRSAVSGGGRG